VLKEMLAQQGWPGVQAFGGQRARSGLAAAHRSRHQLAENALHGLDHPLAQRGPQFWFLEDLADVGADRRPRGPVQLLGHLPEEDQQVLAQAAAAADRHRVGDDLRQCVHHEVKLVVPAAVDRRLAGSRAGRYPFHAHLGEPAVGQFGQHGGIDRLLQSRAAAARPPPGIPRHRMAGRGRHCRLGNRCGRTHGPSQDLFEWTVASTIVAH
jgi:hypothetical protein